MYGLVFEGGGSRGAYQIGAMKAIVELGLEVGGVAGTSVGALNGAMVVQGDIETACDIWSDICPNRVMELSRDEMEVLGKSELSRKDFYLLFKQLRKIIAEKGLDVAPLAKMIDKVIDEDRVRRSPMDFGIVTFDLTDRRPIEVYKEDIPRGKLKDYLFASASFPGFKLKTIDGSVFIDGGFYNSLPVNLIKQKGYADIIVIRTYALGRKKKVDTTGLNIYNIGPTETLGPVLDFGRERARRNMKLGYFDALKVFKGLKGFRYYILPLNDEKYYTDFLMGLSEDKIRRVGEFFGIERCCGKRVLFEDIIPRIADLLKLPADVGYEDIAIGLLEAAAGVSGLERFRIYTVTEFLTEIARSYKPVKEDFLKEIPSFIRGLDVVSMLVRDKIIGSIATELFEDVLGRSGT